jgi:hypothetical protein
MGKVKQVKGMKQYSKTEILEFIYDSEEEKLKHKIELEKQGFQDSGQCMTDINKSFSNPDWRDYGKYFRYNY